MPSGCYPITRNSNIDNVGRPVARVVLHSRLQRAVVSIRPEFSLFYMLIDVACRESWNVSLLVALILLIC